MTTPQVVSGSTVSRRSAAITKTVHVTASQRGKTELGATLEAGPAFVCWSISKMLTSGVVAQAVA
jgi:hypothetical protein